MFIRIMTALLLACCARTQGQDAPSNDHFAAAATFSGVWAEVVGDNRYAGLEDGEPTVGNLPVAATLWWQWTAPTSGQVELAIAGGNFIPVVGVFREEMSPSALIASNYFNSPTSINTASLLRFPAEAGTTYRFQAGSVFNVRGGYFPFGEIRLRLAVLKALISTPANGAKFTAPLSVPVAVDLNDFGGEVQRVVFRAGTNVLAELQQRPMSFTWEVEEPGVYELAATAVDESGHETTSPPVTITVHPRNDAFADRLPIAGTITGSLSGASSESSEPEAPCPGGDHTVWWSWTAPADGQLVIRARTNSPIVPVMSLFSGTQLGGLTGIATNTFVSHGRCGTFCSTRPVLEIDVQAGIEYQLQLTAIQEVRQVFGTPPWFINYDGPYSLELEFSPRPGNDSIAQPTLIQGTSTVLSVTTLGTRHDPDEPSLGGETNARTAWFEWTAPFSGRVTVSLRPIAGVSEPVVIPGTGGTGGIAVVGGVITQTPCLVDYEDPPPPAKFAPLLAVFAGDTLATLQHMGSATDEAPEIWFNAEAGRTYRLAASGVSGTRGSYQVFLLATPWPANDHFASRIALNGDSLHVLGHHRGATTEPFEPTHGLTDVKSVWWSWTAPANGTVSLIIREGATYTSTLGVFTGDDLAALQPVVVAHAAAAFNAEAGQQYQLAVYGHQAEGPVEFWLKLRTPSLDIEKAVPLAGGNAPGVLLRLRGEAGQRFLLEWSVDLLLWSPVSEGTLGSDHAHFEMPLPGWERAFLRVRPRPD